MSPSPTPVTATLARCAAGLILVFATTACSTGPSIAPSATPGEPTALPSARPSASVSVPPATVRPSSPTPASAPPPPAPSASIAAAPTPEPIGPPADGWSRPIQVGAPGRCPTVSALIDATGRNHVAAGCDGGIRVFVESGAGWDDTTFAPPSKRQENDPQLALDGDLLYLAYTRISVEEGGCGDFGLRDVGVYVRTKSLPNGEWSEPTQIGAVADHVQSLRVVDGTIHATVANEADGRRYYETQRGDQYRRYEILNAVGEVALRIGDDGRARVAYEAADAIWYGTFTAGNLTAMKVTGTSRGYRPVLVLGAGDRPYLMWNRGWHGGGCAEPDPFPEDGTWFSTLVGGTWRSEQLTSSQNAASLTVDVGAGRVHAVIDDRKVVYMTKAGSGPWSRQTLGDQQPQEAVIRLDPKGGGLLVTFVAWVDDAERVFVVTHD